MQYKLIYARRITKDISKLDLITKKRLKIALEKLALNPLSDCEIATSPNGSSQRPELGTYRYRVDNYRIIFDIKDNDILILKIGHRRDIYN